jgi:hypothetical protein
LILGFGDFKVIFKVWGLGGLFLGFIEFWVVFRVWGSL